MRFREHHFNTTVRHALLASLVALTCLAGCRSDAESFRNIETAEAVTLYSLDGFGVGEIDYVKHPAPGGELHGCGVLGKVDLNETQRVRVAEALRRGVAEANEAASCFTPRHLLRIQRGGRCVDYLICFQCGHLLTYEGEQENEHAAGISTSPQPVLDEILSSAGIEIAPEAFTEEWESAFQAKMSPEPDGETQSLRNPVDD